MQRLCLGPADSRLTLVSALYKLKKPMSFHNLSPETYYNSVELLRSERKIPHDAHLQLYQGGFHALYEVVKALGDLFLHRRTVIVMKGRDPLSQPLCVRLVKEGFKIKFFLESEKELIPQFIKENEKTLLSVLLTLDDPATGELYEDSSIEEALKDSKVFKIKISHAYARSRPWGLNLDPFEIQVDCLAPFLASATLGARAKIPLLLSEYLDWSKELMENRLRQIPKNLVEDRRQVENFESRQGHSYDKFISTEARLFDRAVIHFPNLDSSVLRDLYQRSHRSEKTSHELLSLSLSGVSDSRSFQWLQDRGISPELLQGVLVIPLQLLGEPFEIWLEQAVAQVEKMQNYF
jgi:hypothetical protein